MDYSHLTFELISERYEEIPERFRELLEADATKSLLARIGAQHSLDHERQVMLEQLVGLIFLGFLSPDDLAGELNDKLFLNFVHARALAREIDEHLFAPNRRDLALVYAPVGGARDTEERVRSADRAPLSPGTSGRTISLESIGAPVDAVRAVPVTPPSRLSSQNDTAPLVIMGNTAPPPVKGPTLRPPRISFSLPFKKPTAAPTPHAATIETPGGGVKRDTKTIDYSETRPGNQTLPSVPRSTVNLDTLTVPQATPGKPQPKLDGNTVDLRRK